MQTYILRGGDRGEERLLVLGRTFNPPSMRFLERAGLREGLRVLDVGCGSGELTGLIHSVAKAEVKGIDADAQIIDIARAKYPQVSFEPRAVEELDAEAEYDLIVARFFLSHLQDPTSALQRMLRAARPGGIIAVEDVDFAGHFSNPQNEAFDRYVALYTRAARQRGANPMIGPRLPNLLREAGARDVRYRIEQRAFERGEEKTMALLTFRHIRHSLSGCEAGELDAIEQELGRLTEDETSMISVPRIFQVWGYR